VIFIAPLRHCDDGEHTDAVLREFGFDAGEVAELRDSRAI